MTKEEKCILAIDKGFTYDSITGIIYGIRGKEIKGKNKDGYIEISIDIGNNKKIHLQGHQFAYYYIHKKVVNIIDHINCNKLDNRINNLRSVTNQQNGFNRNPKGFFCNRNKYRTAIVINGKRINLGTFNTEEEARQAYLDAKKIYHII